MVLKRVAVNLKLPFIEVTGEWQPQALERQAAWELYVELVTRVPVAQLTTEQVPLREALDSLYSIFSTTRGILRKYGPSIAGGADNDNLSFGYLAVALLNGALRPFLAYWHAQLLAYEASRPEQVSPFEHEGNWERAGALRAELHGLREQLSSYTALLAQVTGAPALLRAVEITRDE